MSTILFIVAGILWAVGGVFQLLANAPGMATMYFFVAGTQFLVAVIS